MTIRRRRAFLSRSQRASAGGGDKLRRWRPAAACRAPSVTRARRAPHFSGQASPRSSCGPDASDGAALGRAGAGVWELLAQTPWLQELRNSRARRSGACARAARASSGPRQSQPRRPWALTRWRGTRQAQQQGAASAAQPGLAHAPRRAIRLDVFACCSGRAAKRGAVPGSAGPPGARPRGARAFARARAKIGSARDAPGSSQEPDASVFRAAWRAGHSARVSLAPASLPWLSGQRAPEWRQRGRRLEPARGA